jgi:hypothetical protein
MEEQFSERSSGGGLLSDSLLEGILGLSLVLMDFSTFLLGIGFRVLSPA